MSQSKFSLKLFFAHIPVALAVSYIFWRSWDVPFWECFMIVEGSFLVIELIMILGKKIKEAREKEES